MPLNRQGFMSTYIDNITLEEAITYIEQCIEKRIIGQVIPLNVDQIVRMEWDIQFRAICRESDLLLADGHPLLWISGLYGKKIKEKICGSDLTPVLCGLAEKKGYSVFFLGAAQGIAKKAAENLKKTYKELNIAGTYSPPYGFEKDKMEIEKMNNILKKSGADILFVGMGVPKQEIFIYENKAKYQIPMSFSIGGTIDFIAGKQKRAPKWVNHIGMEWFYRLLHQPKRLFKRYIIDDMKIFRLIWKYRKSCVD